MLKAPRYLGIILIGLVAASGGCTTAPDALAMRVTPTQKVFACDEDVRLEVTLTAHGGPVCYGRESYFAVEFQPDTGDGNIKSTCGFICGTPLMGVLPLYIVLTPAFMLDMADLGARFTVIPDGQHITYRLAMTKCGDGLELRNMDEPSSRWQYVERESLPPGCYRVRVELKEEHDWFPPLFWAPYDKSVVAETEFRIETESEAASG